MKKDFASKQVRTKQKRAARWRWIAYMALFVFGISTVCFFSYRKFPLFTHFYSSATTSLAAWITKHKTHFYQARVKTKGVQSKVASNNEDTAQIHFEFYTALPNMQITVPVTNVDANKNQTIRSERANKEKSAPSKPKLFSADRLEKEWSAELTQNQANKK